MTLRLGSARLVPLFGVAAALACTPGAATSESEVIEQSGTLSPEKTSRIFQQLCRALGRAHELGMVQEVVPEGQQISRANEIAGEITANAPLAVRGTKLVLQQSEGMSTEQSLLLNGLWTMMTSLNSNDLKEAMQAFMEKRAPEFSGS